jgi:hypothetical protein
MWSSSVALVAEHATARTMLGLVSPVDAARLTADCGTHHIGGAIRGAQIALPLGPAVLIGGTRGRLANFAESQSQVATRVSGTLARPLPVVAALHRFERRRFVCGVATRRFGLGHRRLTPRDPTYRRANLSGWTVRGAGVAPFVESAVVVREAFLRLTHFAEPQAQIPARIPRTGARPAPVLATLDRLERRRCLGGITAQPFG